MCVIVELDKPVEIGADSLGRGKLSRILEGPIVGTANDDVEVDWRAKADNQLHATHYRASSTHCPIPTHCAFDASSP